jgi:predicted dehydrogenase
MNKVRWGLIGCGDIARKRVAHALASAAHCELTAVSRARAELAQAFAEEFGAKRWYRDYVEMVADPEVDAVYIATPVHLHHKQTVAAADSGKHVLCEKPMALTVSECEEMISACEENGVLLGVAYYRRFYPVISRIKELLSQAVIGKPVLVEIRAFERINPMPGGDRYWLLEPEQSGGGPMMDFGCHRLEILINLFGPPTSVTGATTSAALVRKVEDTATATLVFPSGCQAWVAVTHATLESRDTFDIYGSDGSMHVDVLNEGVLRIVTRDGERIERHPPHRNLHQPLIEDFVQAVIEHRRPLVDGEIGRQVSLALTDIYRHSL